VRSERVAVSSLLASNSVPVIHLHRISKRFGTFWANRDVSLEVFKGEILAIAGENGAGKTTLMKVLYGHLQPDEGEIRVDGSPVIFRHPREAIRAGIGLVHQQLVIFPQLSALENIVVGFEHPQKGLWTLGKLQKQRVLEICGLFGFDLPLELSAGRLSFVHRQQIELLRVLYRDARVLILDEPTSLLGPLEVERLLSLLKSLKRRGHTVLFITHRLQEVFAIADRISILRRGRCVATLKARETSSEALAQLIVSEEKRLTVVDDMADSTVRPVIFARSAEVHSLFDIRNIQARPYERESGLENFSLGIRMGEVFGIGGIVGNGLRTLAFVSAGISSPEQGEILLGGKDISMLSIEDRMKMGIRWLPANVSEEALLPNRALWENLILGQQRQACHQVGGFLLRRKIVRWAEGELNENDVTYSNVSENIEALSGGNQQKVAVARTLAGPPRFVILEQPTRGLDILAQRRLRDRVLNLSGKGVTFLVISYDLDELLSLCHRIGILYRGRLMGILEGNQATREALGKWMLGIDSRV
jgi:ABC-type uncharacterized transport system ATPase subunit